MNLTAVDRKLFSLVDFLFGAMKFLFFVVLMLVFIIHHILVSVFIYNKKRKSLYYLRSVSRYCRLGLKILNIKVNISNSQKIPQSLIVSNHLSYIDVLVLGAHFPGFFITSREVREIIVLGKIAEMAGCFFIERRKEKRSLETKAEEISMIKEYLQMGFSVILFPEGTSSDGSQVLPFKSTFFDLALEADIPVRPMVIKYKGDGPLHVPWYGEMTFLDHLFKLALQKEVRAEVTLLEQVVGADRFALARESFANISGEYGRN